MSDKLLLVDAFSQIYRAFYAIRSLNAPDGEPVNAIFGFTKMLRKLLAIHAPSHCAVVFDAGPPQRRLSVLSSYKEQRPPTPPDLVRQLPGIHEMLGALRAPVVAVEGEEADDLIATLATQAASGGIDTLIASQDKDFFQIVSPRIGVLRADNTDAPPIDDAAVETRYGVRPGQIVDYLSLVGDSADNIPGARGIGPKTAAELLRTHGSLEQLLHAAPSLDKPKLREILLSSGALLKRNRELIRLHTELPLPCRMEELRTQHPDENRLRELYTRWGFRSLLAELDKDTGSTELRLNL